MVQDVAGGLTINQARIGAGVGAKVLANWIEERPALDHELKSAREHARLRQLGVIDKAAQGGDWQASVAWLKLAFFHDYRQNNNTNVQVNAGNASVVVTEEDRKQMIENWRAIQGTKRAEVVDNVEIPPETP